jgi:hypothetical protein
VSLKERSVFTRILAVTAGLIAGVHRKTPNSENGIARERANELKRVEAQSTPRRRGGSTTLPNVGRLEQKAEPSARI